MTEVTLHVCMLLHSFKMLFYTSNTILFSFKDVLMSTFFFLRAKMASYFNLISLNMSNI